MLSNSDREHNSVSLSNFSNPLDSLDRMREFVDSNITSPIEATVIDLREILDTNLANLAIENPIEVAAALVDQLKARVITEINNQMSEVHTNVVHTITVKKDEEIDKALGKIPSFIPKACQTNLKTNLKKIISEEAISSGAIGRVIGALENAKENIFSLVAGETRSIGGTEVSLTNRKSIETYQKKAVEQIATNTGKLLSKRGEDGKLKIIPFSVGHFIEVIGGMAASLINFIDAKLMSLIGSKILDTIDPKQKAKETKKTDSDPIENLTRMLSSVLPPVTANIIGSFIKVNKENQIVKEILEILDSKTDPEKQLLPILLIANNLLNAIVEICDNAPLPTPNPTQNQMQTTLERIHSSMADWLKNEIEDFAAAFKLATHESSFRHSPLNTINRIGEELAKRNPKFSVIARLFTKHLIHQLSERDRANLNTFERISSHVFETLSESKRENDFTGVIRQIIEQAGQEFEVFQQSAEFTMIVDSFVAKLLGFDSSFSISGSIFGLARSSGQPLGMLAQLTENLKTVVEATSSEDITISLLNGLNHSF